MPQCARAALAGGAGRVAVATASEAARLRAEGIDAPVLVMGALTDTELSVALDAHADVVAWREEFVRAVATQAGGGQPARVHVKLDTGMGRLGAKDLDQARAVVTAITASDRMELAGAMTHFATADERDSTFFDEQLTRFVPFAEELKQSHPECVVHAANSAAVLRSRAAHFDMARCGIAVYGLDPFHSDPAPLGLEPALALRSYVADVKELAAGESVGYGRTWSAPRDTRVAVLPIGYGDGYRRALSNNADVLIGGVRFPVVGTISMDNTTVEVGDAAVSIGDVATLIGGDGDQRVAAEELAQRLGTINYEITCGVSARVPRVYEAP
jgi:alanine racemase